MLPFGCKSTLICSERAYSLHRAHLCRINGDNNWIHFAFSTVPPIPPPSGFVYCARLGEQHRTNGKLNLYVIRMYIYLHLVCHAGAESGRNCDAKQHLSQHTHTKIPNWLTAVEWLMILCPFSHNQRFWMLPSLFFFFSSLLLCFAVLSFVLSICVCVSSLFFPILIILFASVCGAIVVALDN